VNQGERLLAINGFPVQDLIDYLSLSAAESVSLTLAGEGTRTITVAQREEESLGLCLADAVFDGIRRCRNHCVFCFIDQLPSGLRPSLYIKDDDYRLSFLQGNYVTLSGLNSTDKSRIVSHRLSPLYVSVHATDPAVRGRLLGLRRAAPILPLLKELTAAGIRLQVQVVACPGWNDGAVLDRTIEDLAGFWPGIQNLAVVPVGLTAHRHGLTDMAPFDRYRAQALLRQLASWQERLLAEIGTRFAFAADEFYVLAEIPIPAAVHYEDYLQLENGVGLLRSFEDEFRAAWPRWRGKIRPGRLRVVTGHAAAGMWGRFGRLMARAGVELLVTVVTNRFLGPVVTVAGLMAGRDIMAALTGLEPMPTYVPRVALQHKEEVFLDDMTATELAQKTGVEVIEPDGAVFLRAAARALAHAR